MQTKDHRKHMEAAWKAAAEAAKQLERLREQMLRIDRYDKAEEAGGAAECCRDWCLGIYEEMQTAQPPSQAASRSGVRLTALLGNETQKP